MSPAEMYPARPIRKSPPVDRGGTRPPPTPSASHPPPVDRGGTRPPPTPSASHPSPADRWCVSYIHKPQKYHCSPQVVRIFVSHRPRVNHHLPAGRGGTRPERFAVDPTRRRPGV